VAKVVQSQVGVGGPTRKDLGFYELQDLMGLEEGIDATTHARELCRPKRVTVLGKKVCRSWQALLLVALL